MIDLPAHIGRLRIVTMDQAALVMAGLSNEVDCVDEAVNGNYIRNREAVIYKTAIKQAIILKEIIPIRAYTYPPQGYEYRDEDLMLIDNEKININTTILHAEFIATAIWPWVEREMNSNSPWYDSKLVNKNNIGAVNVLEWSEFAGKDTALMFIAGLAIALEKSGSKNFLHGGRLNKSAVAQTAMNAINEYGSGTEINPKSLTNLLISALEAHGKN